MAASASGSPSGVPPPGGGGGGGGAASASSSWVSRSTCACAAARASAWANGCPTVAWARVSSVRTRARSAWELPGTVHTEPGYLEVALVHHDALADAEALVRLRVPASTPGIYLNPFDEGRRLRAPTLLLARGCSIAGSGLDAASAERPPAEASSMTARNGASTASASAARASPARAMTASGNRGQEQDPSGTCVHRTDTSNVTTGLLPYSLHHHHVEGNQRGGLLPGRAQQELERASHRSQIMPLRCDRPSACTRV